MLSDDVIVLVTLFRAGNDDGVVAATVMLHHVSGDKVLSLTRTLHFIVCQ